MKKIEKTYNKMCNFYVSNLHLTTMLLPYIRNKIENKKGIYTLLENDILQEVKSLVSRLNLKEETKEKIFHINWNCSQRYEYDKINELMNEMVKKTKEVYLIIKGLKNYIYQANVNIDKWVEDHLEDLEKKAIKINIINCFEVTDFNENILEILDNHDKIINTAGEKEISEIFEGYAKKENDILKEAN